MKLTLKEQNKLDMILKIVPGIFRSVTVADDSASVPLVFKSITKDRISVSCSAGGASFRAYLDADVREEGEFVVPYQLLASARARMSTDLVLFDSTDSEVRIKAGRMTLHIRQVRNPNDDVLDDQSGVDLYTVDADALVTGFKATGFSIIKGGEVQVVDVVVEGSSDWLNVYTNDAFRAMVWRTPAKNKKVFKVNVPKAFAELISSAGLDPGSVQLGAEGGRVLIKTQNFDLLYPTYYNADPVDVFQAAKDMLKKDEPKTKLSLRIHDLYESVKDMTPILSKDKEIKNTIAMDLKRVGKKERYALVLSVVSQDGRVNSAVNRVKVKTADVDRVNAHPKHMREFMRLACTSAEDGETCNVVLTEPVMILKSTTFLGIIRLQSVIA